MTILFLTLLFKLSDICVAFVLSWWNLWWFWSKLVKFVVKVDEIYDAFGDMWQNFWCSRSKLMKFLVFLVKLVKFVVLLVICRLCRRKITAGQIPQSVGSAQLCWEARLSFLCILLLCVSSLHICRVFNYHLSCIQWIFVMYSTHICLAAVEIH